MLISVCSFDSSLSRAVNHHLSRSESNQKTIKALRALKLESYSWSLKYCVLLYMYVFEQSLFSQRLCRLKPGNSSEMWKIKYLMSSCHNEIARYTFVPGWVFG